MPGQPAQGIAPRSNAKGLSFDNIPRISASRFVHAQHRPFSLPEMSARDSRHTPSSQRLSTSSATCLREGAGKVAAIALLRLGVQLVPERIDQSLIVCADPEVSIPCDGTNFCWARRVVLFERPELLSMPRRNEKFHRKAPSRSVIR